MKNYFVDLIEDAHQLVNEMRKKKNLAPYPFDKIKEHEVDPYVVIHQAMSERKEMPDHDFKTISNVECACGCKTLLSAKSAAAGWTYVYGHRGIAITKTQQLDRQAKCTKQNGPVTDLSPKKMIEVFRKDLDRISKERTMSMENCQRIGTLLCEEQATLTRLELQYIKVQNVIAAIEALTSTPTGYEAVALVNQTERGEYVAN